MSGKRKITIQKLREAVQALGENGKEISYGLIYEAMNINEEPEKDIVRARITSMVKHGEITRTERGSFVYNFKRRARKAAGYDTIWRFVRAAKPDWSIEDCSLLTRISYTHVLRYVNWLEGEGFVERSGRNDRNGIVYRNTSLARSTPETPYPQIKQTDPFQRERVAAATIARLMLCANPYSPRTGRLISEACHVLLARFEKNNADFRTEIENEENCDVE